VIPLRYRLDTSSPRNYILVPKFLGQARMLNFGPCNRPPKVCIDFFQLQHFNTDGGVSGRGRPGNAVLVLLGAYLLGHDGKFELLPALWRTCRESQQAPFKIRNKPWMSSLVSFSSPVERGGFSIAILQGASECTLRGLVSLVPSVF